MFKRNPVETNPERQSNFELLRIVIMVMIVGCHFATHGEFHFDNQITIPRLWWNILEMGGNLGVDVFVLISGFFLIKNTEISPKKIYKLWGQIFFYSVILFFMACLLGDGNFSPLNIIKTLFPITFGQWWFASTYFVLYLIHPFLNKMLCSFTKKEYQHFLLIIFILWSVIPTLTTCSMQSNFLLQFMLYYSIAGYIRLFGFHNNYSSSKWCFLWLFFFRINVFVMCCFYVYRVEL